MFPELPHVALILCIVQVYKAKLHGTEPVAVKCLQLGESLVEVSACRGKASGSLLSQDMHAATRSDESVCMEIKLPPTSSEPKNVGEIVNSNRGIQHHGLVFRGRGEGATASTISHKGSACLVRTPKKMRQQPKQVETSDHFVLREIALLKALRSQYIVGFHGACFQGREAMLVTELMPGGDLWSALRAGEINWWNG
jgi:hypothetical protein